MEDGMQIDWMKVLGAGALLVGGWAAPRAYRALRNVGKTKIKIAEEKLAEAQKRAREAHANADPNDDATHDAAVVRAQKARESAEYWAAVANGIADEKPSE